MYKEEVELRHQLAIWKMTKIIKIMMKSRKMKKRKMKTLKEKAGGL
jgi:hypothetical protein